MNENPRVLKQPNMGPQTELTPETAYLAAITSLPRLLSDMGKVLTGIVEMLDSIDGSLSTIALYHERKGNAESLFTPDDFSSDGNESNEKSDM